MKTPCANSFLPYYLNESRDSLTDKCLSHANYLMHRKNRAHIGSPIQWLLYTTNKMQAVFHTHTASIWISDHCKKKGLLLYSLMCQRINTWLIVSLPLIALFNLLPSWSGRTSYTSCEEPIPTEGWPDHHFQWKLFETSYLSICLPFHLPRISYLYSSAPEGEGASP